MKIKLSTQTQILNWLKMGFFIIPLQIFIWIANGFVIIGANVEHVLHLIMCLCFGLLLSMVVSPIPYMDYGVLLCILYIISLYTRMWDCVWKYVID